MASTTDLWTKGTIIHHPTRATNPVVTLGTFDEKDNGTLEYLLVPRCFIHFHFQSSSVMECLEMQLLKGLRFQYFNMAEADMPNVPLMHTSVQKILSHLKTRPQSAKSLEVVAPFGPEGIASKL